MLDTIFKNFEETDFDFRQYAYQNDELSYLFEEWLPYYRMKYSICKAINPQSILEIGVRYGYGAVTFLKAAPGATYLGIDNDSISFGGSKGAIDWAKKITESYKADFLIADTQQMTSLPGDFYDLIHIDGQQDGDGTIRDMEMALEKGRWILVDGLFWSKENLLASTYFLEKYKNFIDFSIIIPSYAGELLIKTRSSAKNIISKPGELSYEKLQNTYNNDYYLKDCGGYEHFKKHRGINIEDPRLQAAYCLADPQTGREILDIGCGRGELAYAMALTGADVTGIDYSDAAISIAMKTFYSAHTTPNLQYIHGDFLKTPFKTKFNTVIAADFVEHIETSKLHLMFDNISKILDQDGMVVVHTAPSLLYNKHAYEEKRAIARQINSYLPKNPRTYYEDLMHINEQTPESLENFLKEHFQDVLVWVTNLPDLIGSLGKTYGEYEINNSRDIFAVASNNPLDKVAILRLISQSKLSISTLAVTLSADKTSFHCNANESFEFAVSIFNQGREKLVSLSPYPVHICYHWVNEQDKYEIYEGIRTRITLPLLPGQKREFIMNVVAPETKGKYHLQVTLVQESNFWLESVLKNLPLTIETRVS